LVSAACGDDGSEDGASGSAAGSGGSAAGSGGSTAGSGGSAAGSGGGAGGAAGSTSSAGDNDTIVYSDQGGLHKIVDGVETTLGTGPDYAVLSGLRLSPDGANLLHAIGRDTRITSTEDGAIVVDVQLGFTPGTWLDASTALVTTPGDPSPGKYEIVSMDLDGNTTPLLDMEGREYCAVGPAALSPDESQVVLRCGYGLNVDVVSGDLTTGQTTTLGPLTLTNDGTPPIWTGNDYIAYTGSGEFLEFSTPDFGAPVATTAKASAIVPAGPDGVLAIGTEVGPGGAKINTFKLVSIPSGDVEELAWLAEINPQHEKIAFSNDGSKVLFAEQNGIATANVDGSDKAFIKEPPTGSLVPAIQSLTW
jgi:hypothetical protein